MTGFENLVFSSAVVLKFVLILVRCSTMLAVFPIFSGTQIPTHIKIALSASIAFLLYGAVPPVAMPSSSMMFAGEVLAQAFIGLSIGFASTFIFAGLTFAGEIIDTQVGFAVTNILNPTTNTSVTILGQFQLMLASLIFLITDSHHMMIEGMAGSFHVLPLPWVSLNPSLMHDVTQLFAESLDIVFKIAVPIAVALLITNIAMGLLSRVAPQVNIFIVALPAQLGIGLVMFMLSLPLLGFVLPTMFGSMPAHYDKMLHAMTPKTVK